MHEDMTLFTCLCQKVHEKWNKNLLQTLKKHLHNSSSFYKFNSMNFLWFYHNTFLGQIFNF